jgi:hypothetical protein
MNIEDFKYEKKLMIELLVLILFWELSIDLKMYYLNHLQYFHLFFCSHQLHFGKFHLIIAFSYKYLTLKYFFNEN